MQYFFYDPTTKAYTYTDTLPDGQVANNATTIPPVDVYGNGLLDPTWDGTTWVPMSEADFINKHKNDGATAPYTPTNTVSSTDTLFSKLISQVLDAQFKLKQHDQQIAALNNE